MGLEPQEPFNKCKWEAEKYQRCYYVKNSEPAITEFEDRKEQPVRKCR